jgi:hypothetical protein
VIFLLGLSEGQSLQEYETEQQKENIRIEIANISAGQLQRVNHNIFYQCEECLHVEGQNF